MKEEIKKLILESELYGVLETHLSSDGLEERLNDLVDKINSLQDYKDVYDETPPNNTELLALSPDNVKILCSWRPAYNIFTCQSKGESTFGWKYKIV